MRQMLHPHGNVFAVTKHALHVTIVVLACKMNF